MDRQIAGLGIDTLSPDRPEDGYPVHALLLGAGKYIIENIANASLLPPCGSRMIAFPLKIKGGTEAPDCHCLIISRINSGNYQPVASGNQVCLDDDVILWFTNK